jgi:hypothetical protein
MYSSTHLICSGPGRHAQLLFLLLLLLLLFLLLLSLLFLQGVHLPASCRMGTCTSCVCKLLVRLLACCNCTAAYVQPAVIRGTIIDSSKP